MSSHLAHSTKPNTLPYRYEKRETFNAEAVARSTSQSSMGDIACRCDCCYGRESLSARAGRDGHALKYSLDLPSALPPQPSVTSSTSTIDPLSHGPPAHPVFFTDDAKMKLGDRIRRQCFNCRTTATKAWRRSVLSPGKMVCNKCGLFERTHAVPRPKTFPHRHHLQPTPVCTNMGHPFDHAKYCPHDDHLSVRQTLGSTGQETSSQVRTWVNHRAVPPTSHLSPFYTVSPQPPSSSHYNGSHLPSTVPTEAVGLPSRLDARISL